MDALETTMCKTGGKRKATIICPPTAYVMKITKLRIILYHLCLTFVLLLWPNNNTYHLCFHTKRMEKNKSAWWSRILCHKLMIIHVYNKKNHKYEDCKAAPSEICQGSLHGSSKVIEESLPRLAGSLLTGYIDINLFFSPASP